MRKSILYIIFVAGFFSQSCNPSFKTEKVQYSSYRIQQSGNVENAMTTFIKPYSDSISDRMKIELGEAAQSLERKRTANTLGFFMTDAFLEMSRQRLDKSADISFMNSGGIRIPDIPSGKINQGKIYELMPFDNVIVIMKLKGSVLKQYLDTLASHDAIIASGMTADIKNKTAINVKIGGAVLNPDKEYVIVNSDYVANNSRLLKNFPKSISGYFMRDAIIDYVKYLNAQGKKVTVSNPDRINYVN